MYNGGLRGRRLYPDFLSWGHERLWINWKKKFHLLAKGKKTIFFLHIWLVFFREMRNNRSHNFSSFFASLKWSISISLQNISSTKLVSRNNFWARVQIQWKYINAWSFWEMHWNMQFPRDKFSSQARGEGMKNLISRDLAISMQCGRKFTVTNLWQRFRENNVFTK